MSTFPSGGWGALKRILGRVGPLKPSKPDPVQGNRSYSMTLIRTVLLTELRLNILTWWS